MRYWLQKFTASFSRFNNRSLQIKINTYCKHAQTLITHRNNRAYANGPSMCTRIYSMPFHGRVFFLFSVRFDKSFSLKQSKCVIILSKSNFQLKKKRPNIKMVIISGFFVHHNWGIRFICYVNMSMKDVLSNVQTTSMNMSLTQKSSFQLQIRSISLSSCSQTESHVMIRKGSSSYPYYICFTSCSKSPNSGWHHVRTSVRASYLSDNIKIIKDVNI